MYSNNMLNFQESTTILNAGTKKSGNLLNALHTYGQLTTIHMYTSTYIHACMHVLTPTQMHTLIAKSVHHDTSINSATWRQ